MEGAANFLAEKLSSALLEKLKEEVSVVVDFKEEFESIYQEVVCIKSLLNDAGEQTQSQSMTNWLQNLRDVLTKVMDLVECCEEVDKYNASVVLASHHWIRRQIILLRKMCRKIGFRRQMGPQIQDLKKNINDINGTASKYLRYLKSFVDVNTSSEEEKRKSCSRLLQNVPSVGIQKDIDVITELIFQKDGPTVIAVVGTGGQGKTRVLQNVFHSKAVRNGFKHRIWLSVSEKFKIDHLLHDIAYQIKLQGEELAIKDPVDGHHELTIQLPNDYHHKLTEVSTEGLRDRIHRYFGEEEINNVEQEKSSLFVRLRAYIHRYLGESKKPCLFVLDDVWGKDVLQQISSMVLQCLNNQNKIVVSTRDRGVSDAVGAYTHQMEYLSDEDSLELFCMHAFNDLPDMKLPEDLKCLEKLIVNKCTRLPMAVEAIGKRMSDVSKISHQWEIALRFLDKAVVIKEDVMPTLRSSYNSLPYHLKACFHSFASFPPNTRIKSENLVYAWVAIFKEFLPAQANPFDTAWSYLKQLVDRCLIQDLKVDVDGRVKCCQIQDFFHGLAQLQSLNEAKCLLKPGEEITQLPVGECKDARRISLAKNDISTIKQPIHCPDLRILYLCENFSLTSISQRFFLKLKYLAVLDLSKTGIKSLPRSVGNLKRLKLLNLSGTKIKELPESLAGLRSLQFLDVSRCEDLRTLHPGIGEHRFMLHLNVKGCKNLESLPSGISKLWSLRTLKLKGVVLNRKPAASAFRCTNFKDSNLLQCLSTDNAFGWTGFKDLTDLQRLSITFNRDTILSKGFGELRIWSKMRNMQFLSLQYEPSGDDCRDLPPALGVMDRLESLRLHRLLVPRLADLTFWEYHLQKLKMLVLEGDETYDGNYYRGIEKIPNLRKLRLLSNKKCVQLPKEFGQPKAFPKLEELNIRDFNKLKKFPSLEDNAMPRLKHLRIENCSQMRDMPEGLQNLKMLQELQLDNILVDRLNVSYLEVEATWKWKARSIKITPVEEATPETDESPWDHIWDLLE